MNVTSPLSNHQGTLLHTLLGDEPLAAAEQKENGDYVVVFK